MLALVNEYIKAFYLDENDLESWIRSNREAITAKQFIGLINLVITNAGGGAVSSVAASLTSSAGSAAARKIKQKLTPLLEDLEKQK